MSQRVKGIWQLGREQPEAPGTLIIDDSGIRLEVVRPGAGLGSFDDPARYEVIWGRTEHLPGGHHVTLTDCFRSSATSHASLLTTETIVANKGFVGEASIESPEEQLFDSFTLSFDGLYAWLGKSGRVRDDREADIVAAASYRLIPPTIAQLDAAELHLGVAVSSSHGMSRCDMEETAFVRVRLTDPCTFRELRSRFASPLLAFFHLATGQPCAVTRHEVGVADPASPIGESRFKVLTRWKHTGQGEPGNPFEMLFTYSQVDSRFTEILTKWFELYDRAPRAIDLILAPSSMDSLPIDCALAYTMRGLQDLAGKGLLEGAPALDDALELATNDATEIAQAFQQAIVETLGADAAIAPYSGTWERPAFWAQLLGFLLQHETVVRVISQGPVELWTRLTEVDDRLWGVKPDSFEELVDLYWLGQQAAVVGRVAVLRAIGFSVEDVGKMLARDPVFYQLGRKRR